MELTLTRMVFEEEYTEGQLFVDNFYFCDTLEDRTRDFNQDGDLDEPGEEKVYGETAIPFGRYKVIMSYSQRFKKVMPELVDVTAFSGIRIHAGNTAADSHGCILTGKFDKPGRIKESKATTESLYQVIEEAIKNREKVYIEII